MSLKTGSHAVHYHSVQWTLDLWRAMSRMISELQRPLPAGCHLIPEIVATWNREAKGSIDVYCCFQKNCKAVYAHLCPVGAIWLRLIMTCVYNAYHAYGLSQSVEYLLNQEECKSFSGFHKHRSRQLSFKQFCQELANDLNIEVVAPSMYASSSSSKDESRVMSEEDSLECNPYNKREAFFNKVPLIEQRINRSAHHKRVAMQKQMSCIWCCRVDHSTARTKHYRHQRKTTVACPICGVPLCVRPRYNGESCFNMFHTAETLFDPCCEETRCLEVTVRAGDRGNIPPSRRTRQETSEGNQLAQWSHSTTDMVAGSAEGWMVPPIAHGTIATAMSTRQDSLPVAMITEGVGSAVTSVVGVTWLFQSPTRGQARDFLCNLK